MPAHEPTRALSLRIADSGASLQDPPVTASDTIEFGRIRAALRRQRVTILTPVLLMAVLGVAYLVTTPRYYDAYSTLLLNANMSRTVQQVGGIDGGMLSDDTVENARVVIQSSTIANNVVDALNLAGDATFLEPPTSGLSRLTTAIKTPIRQLRAWIEARLPTAASTPAGEQPAADDDARLVAAKILQGEVEVQRLGRSAAVLIRYRSHDPVLAAKVASTFADAYVADMLKANFDATEETTNWMRTRLEELQRSAQEAADRAEAFRVQHGLISSSGALLSDDAMSELNTNLTAAIGETARARATLETYDAALGRGAEALVEGNAPVIVGGESPTLKDLANQINDMRARLERLTAASGENSAQARGTRRTLQSLADRLFIEMQAAREEAQTAVQVGEARVAALQGSLDAAVSESTAKGGAQVELRALERQAETLSGLYQSMLVRSQEVEQQSSFPVTNARVLSYAELPKKAAGPSTLRVLGVALLLGLMIGLVRAAMREGRDRALRTGSDIAAEVNLPFLGYLPRLPRLPASARNTPERAKIAPIPPSPGGENLPVVRRTEVPTVHAPLPALYFRDSIYSETLRRVRHASEAIAIRGVPTAIGVSSVQPAASRAAVTLNLAGILAGQGRSVLVIDADPRGRGLSRLIGIEGRHGLSDALLGNGDWRDMTVAVALTEITALSSGTAGAESESTDVITTDGLRNLVNEARKHFDFVVIDAAPLYPVVEGRAALRAVDQFVLVAPWGGVDRGVLKGAVSSDPALMQHCLGIVFDAVNLRQLRRRYLDQDATDRLITANESYGGRG